VGTVFSTQGTVTDSQVRAESYRGEKRTRHQSVRFRLPCCPVTLSRCAFNRQPWNAARQGTRLV